MDASAPLFATCARGLEPVLADELQALGLTAVEPGRGGVAFRGGFDAILLANLHLRTAVRVLAPLIECEVSTPESLYDVVRSVDWSRYLTLDQTLAVDCNLRDSYMTHSLYAALKVKDAICDQFRERVGRRPSVDTESPNLLLNLHISRNHMILSRDSSGDSLHKRGYRPVQTVAPLNEALAAGLLLTAGYDGSAPLFDPLCGSATFAIEGAWISTKRPPGLTRKRFGFQGWPDFDVARWAELRDAARKRVLMHPTAAIWSCDQRRDVIDLASQNARTAGVGHAIRLTVSQLHDAEVPDRPGTLIVNPPYGERIGEVKELMGLYKQLGSFIQAKCAGWRAFVFNGSPQLAEAVGLPVVRETPFYNGRIPCRLVEYASK